VATTRSYDVRGASSPPSAARIDPFAYWRLRVHVGVARNPWIPNFWPTVWTMYPAACATTKSPRARELAHGQNFEAGGKSSYSTPPGYPISCRVLRPSSRTPRARARVRHHLACMISASITIDVRTPSHLHSWSVGAAASQIDADVPAGASVQNSILFDIRRPQTSHC
jgi:hypothetical protein